MLPPLLVDLVLPQVTGLLFHALLLLAGLLFQVKVLESDVLIIHELALFPLAEAVLIILALVATEVVLDCASLLEGEFIETELKVNQVLVDTCSLQPFGTASLVHLAVG